jgi:hypothetical protein
MGRTGAQTLKTYIGKKKKYILVMSGRNFIGRQFISCPELLWVHGTSQNSKGTNVPQTFRYLIGMKPKSLSLFLNLSYQKRSFLFGPGEQVLDQIETICFSIRQIRGRYQIALVSVPKRYQNVCPFVFDIMYLSCSYLWVM